MEHLHDAYGRGIDYLRISVTDKCNLRCVYCMPAEGVPFRPHEELLRAEEIARFVRLVVGEGIRRVRLTGGEPLVFKGIVDLVREIRAIPQIEDIALTTNGAALPRLAPALKDAGLDRVNISLDTLDAEQFRRITRIGRIEDTLAGIKAALAHGFDPVKINCVVVRRLNQDALAFAKLSLARPLHVRFIEYMPIGNDETRSHGALDPAAEAYDASAWGKSDVVPTAELIDRINAQAAAEGLGALEPVEAAGMAEQKNAPDEEAVSLRRGGEERHGTAAAKGAGSPAAHAAHAPLGAGPARYYRFPGAQGTVGFISAMSNHFCSSCNRLRLTADGAIRPCLFSDDEYPVRDALQRGADDEVLATYRAALAHKPKEHELIEGTERFMSQIGG